MDRTSLIGWLQRLGNRTKRTLTPRQGVGCLGFFFKKGKNMPKSKPDPIDSMKKEFLAFYQQVQSLSLPSFLKKNRLFAIGKELMLMVAEQGMREFRLPPIATK